MARKKPVAPQQGAVMVQSVLIPTKRPKTTLRRVKLSDIDIIAGQADPTQALLNNVGEWGIFQPVALGQKPDGRYFVKAGRRRVIAAIEAKDTYIDASITGPDVPAEVVQLSEHSLRRENPIGDLNSIERLLAERFASVEAIDAKRQIAQHLGMPVARIDKLLKLSTLIPELRADLASNQLKPGVAILICESSLNQAEQLVLHDRLSGTGKLSKSDVYALRREANGQQTTLPGMPAPAEPSDMVDATPLRPVLQSAAQRLNILRDRFPGSATDALNYDQALLLVAEAIEMVETAYNMLDVAPESGDDEEAEPVAKAEEKVHVGADEAWTEKLRNANQAGRAELEAV